MNYEDMLRQIAVGAGLEKDEADRVTRSFFETLAQRLGNEEAREFASQLPIELQNTLAPTDPDVEKFSTEEFLSRMGQAAGVEPARAGQAAHAVWQTVKDAVDSGELGDVKSQLPSEFTELFEASGTPGTPGAGRQD